MFVQEYLRPTRVLRSFEKLHFFVWKRYLKEVATSKAQTGVVRSKVNCRPLPIPGIREKFASTVFNMQCNYQIADY